MDKILKNKKILIVSGGWSSERKISLLTGSNVYNSLKKTNLKVTLFKLNKNNLNKILLYKPDIIFNALHGEFGEDGGLACFAQNNNIKITHSTQVSSSLCLDKLLTKKMLKLANININLPRNYNPKFINNIDYPIILKPNRGGSSIGVKSIHNLLELKRFMSNTKDLIIEEKIIGKELTVTVAEIKNKVKSLAVTEINFNSNFYDYKAKYKKGYSNHILPAKIPKKEYDYLMRISEVIFKVLGCKSLVRIDFIMKRQDNKNLYYFLEINTHPGLTSLSLAPEQANFIGISYVDMVLLILNSSND